MSASHLRKEFLLLNFRWTHNFSRRGDTLESREWIWTLAVQTVTGRISDLALKTHWLDRMQKEIGPRCPVCLRYFKLICVIKFHSYFKTNISASAWNCNFTFVCLKHSTFAGSQSCGGMLPPDWSRGLEHMSPSSKWTVIALSLLDARL